MDIQTRESHRRLWNADDIEELGGHLFSGRTIAQIAIAMGRSQEAVRAKAQALDMLPKRVRGRSIGGAQSAFFVRGR